MSILRNPNRARFTVIDNRLMESGLSMEAIGLASYLLSKPDGWMINQTHLRRVFDCGKDKVSRVMLELQSAGYLIKQYIRDAEGKLAGTEFILKECADFPTCGFPDRSETPSLGETRPLVNTDSLVNTELNNIGRQSQFDSFWQAYPKKAKKKPSSEIWKRKRLDSIADQLVADVQNRIANDRRWLEGFIPDPTTYLNQERWTDEIELNRGQANGQAGRQLTGIDASRAALAERIRQLESEPSGASNEGLVSYG